ncbi:tetratricopeptide repeat protein [Mesorhizobium sp. M0184]
MADYGQAIMLDPAHAKAFRNRGRIWQKKGEDDRAIADYDKAISLDPKGAPGYDGRGFVWSAKGDYARATADYDQAISLDPKYAYAYLGRGILFFYSGALAKAQADFGQAATLKPDNAYFAIWLEMTERRSGAVGHLQEATEKLDMTKWPAPAVRMLLGELTPAEVSAAADDADPAKKRGNSCEANLFIAELDRLQRHDGEALRLYRVAASDCPGDYYEYVAAKAALHELGAVP